MNRSSSKIARIGLIKKSIERNRKKRFALTTYLNLAIAKRKSLLKVCLIILLFILNGRKNRGHLNRSCRRLQRNSGWWDIVWNVYDDSRFKKAFRITKETFLYILGKIRHVIERNTVNEILISPEQRLAICLFRLGRGDYLYTIAEMTGLGTSTICSIVSEISQLIVDTFWDSEVDRHMPKNKDEFCQRVNEMQELWQFPCCWCALDGCHIPIKCPPGGLESSKEYHNFKNFYSIVLMAMVDANYRFIWASCGFPGNSHDSIIFQSTKCWQQLEANNHIHEIGQSINGVHVPLLVLADSAFQMKTWLMKPYTNAVLTARQKYFNYRLSRARMVTEGAYGQLKGRWRILYRKCESSANSVKIMTLACVVLHNICISRQDNIPATLDITVDPETNRKRISQEIQDILHMTKPKRVNDSDAQALKIREVLAGKFQEEKEVVTQ